MIIVHNFQTSKKSSSHKIIKAKQAVLANQTDKCIVKKSVKSADESKDSKNDMTKLTTN